MSINNIVKTTVVLSLFAFVLGAVSLVAHAQTYTNNGTTPAYSSEGTYLPSGTSYSMNGINYTANGSSFIPTGTTYTVNGVSYVGGLSSTNSTAQNFSTPNTGTGGGNYTYLPPGTMYTVNGVSYVNTTGTYVPNGATYTVNGTMYVANGGTYSPGMSGGIIMTPTNPTFPTFPNTGLGGGALINWSMLALGILGVATVAYFARRNSSHASF